MENRTNIDFVMGEAAPRFNRWTAGMTGYVYTDSSFEEAELFVVRSRYGTVSICDRDRLICWAEEDSESSGQTVFWRGTMRQMLKEYSSLSPDDEWTEDDHEESDWIARIADEFGWDTILYRADYLFGEGEYTHRECTHLEAAIAELEHDREYTVRTARYATAEELDEFFKEDEDE